MKDPSTLLTGLIQRAQPSTSEPFADYVDDYLAVGPKDVVNAFFEHLPTTWMTADPVFPKQESQLLGHHARDLTFGLLLHQMTYTEALLSEYKDVRGTDTTSTLSTRVA